MHDVGYQVGYQIGAGLGNIMIYGTLLMAAVAGVRKVWRSRKTVTPADWAPPAGPRRS